MSGHISSSQFVNFIDTTFPRVAGMKSLPVSPETRGDGSTHQKGIMDLFSKWRSTLSATK
jgi:hypothetical protein